MSTQLLIGVICDHESTVLQQAIEKAGYSTARIPPEQLLPESVPKVQCWVIDCIEEDLVVDAIAWLEPEVIALSNRPDHDDEDNYGAWSAKILRTLDKWMSNVKHAVGDGKSSTPQGMAGVEGVWLLAGAAGCLGAVSEFFWTMTHTPPVSFIYAQHIEPDRQQTLTAVGRANSQLECNLALGRHWLNPRQLLIAPASCRLEFSQQGEVFSIDKPWASREQPNIDQLMMAMSGLNPSPTGVIIFSGGGKDGSAGLKALKGVGAKIWAQNPESADAPAMPHHAIQTGLVDKVADPADLADAFMDLYPEPEQ